MAALGATNDDERSERGDWALDLGESPEAVARYVASLLPGLLETRRAQMACRALALEK